MRANDFYEKFYKLNKEKIIFKSLKDHSVDIKKVDEYINYCPPEFEKLIRYITTKVVYTSLDNFLIKLYECYDDLLKIIIDSKINYILEIMSDVTKSNFWLALLFFKYIEERNYTYIFDKILISICNLCVYQTNKYDTTNYKFIYIDDCSYTGGQLRGHIRQDSIVVVPYISETALEKISEKKSHIIYKTKIEKVFNDIPNEEFNKYYNIFYLDGTEFKSILSLFNIYANNYLQYFQHKLPDGTSIPQYFLLYAPIKTNYKILKNDKKIELSPVRILKKNPAFYIDWISDCYTDETSETSEIYKNLHDENNYKIYEIKTDKKCINLLKNCEKQCLEIKKDYKGDENCITPPYKNIVYDFSLYSSIENLLDQQSGGYNKNYKKKYLKYKLKYINLKIAPNIDSYNDNHKLKSIFV